ncbi:MAG TPA: hypothetical protein VMS38_35020 [Pseudorhodoferax sp.]|nr:hypothetical protein [Pseudorhodoferax sp.]
MLQPQAPQNPARRRLAKGAVAVPAVLASISTKNALANPIYGCTVSGKMSGNASPAARNKTDKSCKAGFNTPDQWATFYSQDKNKTDVPGWLNVQAGSGKTPTRYKVFTGSSSLTFNSNKALTINAFAVYCNAEEYGISYHVSQTECEQLFLVASGKVFEFQKNGRKWGAVECGEYLTMLATV